MGNYRLNKTSQSINAFIAEYIKEKGFFIHHLPTIQFPYWGINEKILTGCSPTFNAELIGIDDFLKKIDELVAPTLTMGNTKAHMTYSGVHIGAITVSHCQMEELIHWYNKNR